MHKSYLETKSRINFLKPIRFWLKDHASDKKFKKRIVFIVISLIVFGIFSFEVFYPPSQKTESTSSRMNAKRFLLRVDFALENAWGEDSPTARSRELHTQKVLAEHRILRQEDFQENIVNSTGINFSGKGMT